jgi:hypothetical protein
MIHLLVRGPATYNGSMVILNAHFDGKVIVPDEPTGLAAGTRLRVTLEPMDQPASPASGKLELPLLTGVDPQVVRTIMEGSEFDIENAKIERFLHPLSEKSR